jgi:hypothetical protein
MKALATSGDRKKRGQSAGASRRNQMGKKMGSVSRAVGLTVRGNQFREVSVMSLRAMLIKWSTCSL